MFARLPEGVVIQDMLFRLEQRNSVVEQQSSYDLPEIASHADQVDSVYQQQVVLNPDKRGTELKRPVETERAKYDVTVQVPNEPK